MRARVLESTETAQNQNTASIDCRTLDAFSFQLLISATDSAGAETFADGDVTVGTDEIAITGHGWLTGRKVAATTSGALPTGLSATDYYVIRVDADTIQLASSYANAVAGTAVDITAAAGGGTHTLTPAATDIDFKLQASNDNTNWDDIASAAVTGISSGNESIEKTAVGVRYARAVITVNAGQATMSVIAAGNDDKI